ncbi:ankyrin repeat domain-containing protein [Methylomonas sp. ZR1]|uniref:ankyrin repeat domain-containing protein n=1 Tax=Methylomonas sp. ZR1 TaxID=1797072 RepID=UPI001490F2F0|nr:ankyrin repeat domain-containing protein [Methylomonas sp. ZR1]NOV32474.1 ankyrin repeat domain-containing protein [Methylomonas sp. ZR1]
MYRILLLSFFVLPGCQTNVRPGSACQSIIEIADAGKIQSSVLKDEPSLREAFPAVLKTSIYTVKEDLNGDGFEEIFGSFTVDASIKGLVAGINSEYELALINPARDQGNEIKVSGAQDFINPITTDSYEKRVIKVDGVPYIVVLNAGYRGRHAFVTDENSPRAVWRLTGDFQLAVECELEQFQEADGKKYYRILEDDERILREAKEMRTPDNNPWYLISRLPGLTAFEVAFAAGWDINYAGKNSTTPLWVAIYERRLDLVKALLLKGALPNVFPKEPEKGYEYRSVTPIEYAITSSEDSYDLAKVLIETVGSKNLKAQNGDSALSEAILYERPDIIELLFNNGAEVDDLSVTQWVGTAENDSAESVLKLFLAHGLDLNKSYSFKFPVSGIKRINENTLSVGPEITFAEKKLTPLEFARYMGNKPAEKLLIQFGAR